MRCPYCGGINADQARFCTSCGRDLVPQKPSGQQAASQRYQSQGQRPASSPSYTQPSSYTQPRPPGQQPQRSAPPSQPARTAAPARQQVAAPAPPRPREAPVQAPPAPPAPDSPAPFPPRTIEQLKALTTGALPFTVSDESVINGRKKTISIVYARCAAWQQVATLLKALEQYRSDVCETVIIQGVRGQDVVEYGYTNGQLRYDRNVPLGSQRINRYQIETGGSLDAESVRIVLAE